MQKPIELAILLFDNICDGGNGRQVYYLLHTFFVATRP